MLKNNKKIILTAIISVVATLGISYALFTTIIEGEGKQITIDSKELKIVFIDTNEINATDIEPNWQITKTFSVENKTNSVFKYDIGIKDLVNTFVTEGNLQYKITRTSETGLNMSDYKNIPMSSTAVDTVLQNNIEIAGNTKQEYILELIYKEANYDQSEDMGRDFSGKLNITYGTSVARCESNTNTLECKVLADNPSVIERTSFSSTLTQTNTGRLYKTNLTEDDSTVYYFAGDARNNWVVFGTETKSGVTYDICWRIIRTNTDDEGNGLRLLYSGVYDSKTQECGNTTSGYITTAIYGSSNSNASFVGYMRSDGTDLASDRNVTDKTDTSKNSPVKTAIDNWYSTKTNLGTLSSKLNNKAIYCNDRSIGSGEYVENTNFYFGAYTRLASNKKPSLKCGTNQNNDYIGGTQATEDKFTVDSSTGNGLLTYPIALMTADEVSMAGAVIWTNLSSPYAWYFKNKNNTGVPATDSIVGGSWWWTMSPCDFDSSVARVFAVGSSSSPGFLGYNSVPSSGALRPVISLTSDALWNGGTGEYDDPYTVK